MTASRARADADRTAQDARAARQPVRGRATGWVLATGLLALTAACDIPQEGPGRQACAPAAYAHLVGQKADAAKLPAGLKHRTFQRGSMITMDYDDDRLNLVTDANGVIVDVTCG